MFAYRKVIEETIIWPFLALHIQTQQNRLPVKTKYFIFVETDICLFKSQLSYVQVSNILAYLTFSFALFTNPTDF